MRIHWQKLIKQFHPEGIPWPGSLIYNAVSSTAIFRQHYELVAQDIAQSGTPSRILDIGTGSLHHWKDSISALCEAYRVLMPGGHALIYDLVRDLPKAVCQDIRLRFGSFRIALLWLHSFEEPFLNAEEMESLGRQSEFVFEGTRFTGALCCLMLGKPAVSSV